jgi:hypothetical protein
MNFNLNFPIVKIVMIMYLFVFANAMSTRINQRIVDKIESNHIAKHLIGLITIAVILSLFNSTMPIKELAFYSIAIYVVYLLSTKVSRNLLLACILILAGLYFMSYVNDKRLRYIKLDQTLSGIKKEELIAQLENKNKYLSGGYIAAVVIGSLFYEQKKSGQFGGSYSLVKFFD